MSVLRNWCVTAWYENEIKELPEGVRYIVVGHEVCPDTGKKHQQAYIEFLKGQRMSAVKKIFGEKCHCERRMGTVEQAVEYCKKEENFEEFGECGGKQGKRSDLEEMREMIIDGNNNNTRS